jgi:hypothetical protein
VVLIAGTVSGVIAGSVIRVELLPGPRVFDLVVATVRLIPAPVLVSLAVVVGCVGGIYGLGGGAFLAPVLVGSGHKP